MHTLLKCVLHVKTRSSLVYQMLTGRGRIIGDYRRIALYGIDYLMEQKKRSLTMTGYHTMSEDVIRLREEITEQYRAVKLK